MTTSSFFPVLLVGEDEDEGWDAVAEFETGDELVEGDDDRVTLFV